MGHAVLTTTLNVFGSRSSLNFTKLGLDNNQLLDDFLNIDDLEEFPDEDLAAPISNNYKINHVNIDNYTTCTSCLTSSKSSSHELEPELEWLSSFKYEAFCEDLELPKESKGGFPMGMAIPGRPRSKRSGRTKARVWSYGRKPCTEEGITSSTITCEKLTDSDASSGSSPAPMQAAECKTSRNDGRELLPAWKKMKKGDYEEEEEEEEEEDKEEKMGGEVVLGGRRCDHCLSQKTPQWRAGPGGAKTLCNACGVRYKSGRLFPEYRPAKSPTFLSSMHSNSHKKVIEMRRQQKLYPTNSHDHRI